MEWFYMFAPLALLVIEWFLGETDLVKPNSIIAMILGGLKAILEAFKKA